jgi:hypothetical protein
MSMKRPTHQTAHSLQQLLDFLCKLESLKLHFVLEHNRAEAVMVLIAVPGERWEIEFFADGSIEVEIFDGSGGVLSGTEAHVAVERLLTVHGD